MKNIIITVISLLIFTVTQAQTAATTSQLMEAAYAKATKENKKVFVKFSASWCSWCHKMDASMKDPTVSKFFEDNYVVVHLIVDENEKNKHLETEGANEFRKKYHGEDAGLPFWFIVDTKGTLLADSYIRTVQQTLADKGANIGCPAKTEEIIAFIEALKKTSNITQTQQKLIYGAFKKNAQKSTVN